MPCYKPINAWQSKHKKPNGKSYLRFNPKVYNNPKTWDKIKVPCGQCIGCRLGRSLQWAVRCHHENQLHLNSSFITLTFSDAHLDPHKSLVKADFQKFMKRLRKHYDPLKIRYYHCGEYGDKFKRPHHHACLFGIDFEDKIFLRESNNGDKMYTSEILKKIWPYGLHEIGEVNFKSAAYVARYITKKITGPAAANYYNDIDQITGEIFAERLPEYTTMSRRPGIGKKWFDKYYGDWFSHDMLICNNKKLTPPKYYDKLYELIDPEDLKKIKENRKIKAKKNEDNNTPDRLIVREDIQNRRAKQLIRNLE